MRSAGIWLIITCAVVGWTAGWAVGEFVDQPTTRVRVIIPADYCGGAA